MLVLHEDAISWGYGAEIAARIADELFDFPRCAGSPAGEAKTFLFPIIPYQEDAVLPQPADIVAAGRALAAY